MAFSGPRGAEEEESSPFFEEPRDQGGDVTFTFAPDFDGWQEVWGCAGLMLEDEAILLLHGQCTLLETEVDLPSVFPILARALRGGHHWSRRGAYRNGGALGRDGAPGSFGEVRRRPLPRSKSRGKLRPVRTPTPPRSSVSAPMCSRPS